MMTKVLHNTNGLTLSVNNNTSEECYSFTNKPAEFGTEHAQRTISAPSLECTPS